MCGSRAQFSAMIKLISFHHGAFLCFSLLFPLLVATQPSSDSNNDPTQQQLNSFAPSIAIIIVILIAALFFMGFFSIYIRHCADSSSGSVRPLGLRASISRSRRDACGLDPLVIHTFPTLHHFEGLDPLAVSAVFSAAQYMGEKQISGDDCFALKLSADQKNLTDRSDSTAEMIKHVTYGYFSQRSGLLVYLEDSYLTRIQSPGTYPTYWEVTMSTKMEDYRTVEGVMIAHAGQSTAVITRFGDSLKARPTITRLEESWTIDDVAFNVPGLSVDCFIPPKELLTDFSLEEDLDWRSPLHG